MEFMKQESSSEDYEELISEALYTGMEVNYSIICPTKLWLFTKQVNYEHESDLVVLGRLIHENYYKNKVKNIMIDNKVSLDFITHGENIIIHEVKKSDKMKEADEMQMLYYIYFLQNKGIKNVHGVIHYPSTRKKIVIHLTRENMVRLRKTLETVKKIKEMTRPPTPSKKKYCKKCSYYEFCWV